MDTTPRETFVNAIGKDNKMPNDWVDFSGLNTSDDFSGLSPFTTALKKRLNRPAQPSSAAVDVTALGDEGEHVMGPHGTPSGLTMQPIGDSGGGGLGGKLKAFGGKIGGSL